MFYAHSGENPDKSDWQLLQEHLMEVAKKSEEFAEYFDKKEIAYYGGLFHDLGKYFESFQERLNGCKKAFNHSEAGVLWAHTYFESNLFQMLYSYIISGHHGGLPDYEDGTRGALKARIQQARNSQFPDQSEIETQINEMVLYPDMADYVYEEEILSIQSANLIRMIYSTLVDADFLDTERVMNKKNAKYRGKLEYSIESLLDKFEDFLKTLKKKSNASERISQTNKRLNEIRNEISEACYEKSKEATGVFNLTVPTGGGKTLSSMRFALNHAKANGLRRIIYVIPFTSIIEQNAKVFKNIFGADMVLEHHSDYQFEDTDDKETDNETTKTMKLATENWDAPIVVTTNVQFFESLFANKPSKCRKLHNIASSVVIFDEAQMFPLKFLMPVMASLSDLVLNYRCSLVMCTATQPNFAQFFSKSIKPIDIIGDPKALHNRLKRVQGESLGEVDGETLIEYIKAKEQVLTIVNTRKHAGILYEDLVSGNQDENDSTENLHLSARMTAVHRQIAIARIKLRLLKDQKCRVVSTQLVEAGVDFDFPYVYRALAGLDSIVQAAGRCNREWKMEYGKLFVFDPEAKMMPGGWIGFTASQSRQIVDSDADLLAIESLNKYFDMILYKKEKLGIELLEELHYKDSNFCIPFKEIAEKYKLIEEDMRSVIVPDSIPTFLLEPPEDTVHDDVGRLIELRKSLNFKAKAKHKKNVEQLLSSIRYFGLNREVRRKLQPYTVQIYIQEYNQLRDYGAILELEEGVTVLTDPQYYSDKTGLVAPEGDITQENLIF